MTKVGAGNFTAMRKLLAVGLLGLMGCAGRVPVAQFPPAADFVALKVRDASAPADESPNTTLPPARTLTSKQISGLRKTVKRQITTRPAERHTSSARLGRATLPTLVPSVRLPDPPANSRQVANGYLLQAVGWVLAIGGIGLGILVGSWLGVGIAVIFVAVGAIAGLYGTLLTGNLP